MSLPDGLLLAASRGWSLQITYGSPAYWIFLGLLVVVLLFALHRVYREWQEIHDVEEPDTPEDLLRSFREAHALGELDDDEMRRVEDRLAPASTTSGRSPRPDDQPRAPLRTQARPEPSRPAGQAEGPDAVSAEDQPGSAGRQPDRAAGHDTSSKR